VRISYKAAVQWIAFNDEWIEPEVGTDLESTAEMLTVVMLADLAGKTPQQVAKDVLKIRKRERRGY
jgi:hypothetical protein